MHAPMPHRSGATIFTSHAGRQQERAWSLALILSRMLVKLLARRSRATTPGSALSHTRSVEAPANEERCSQRQE